MVLHVVWLPLKKVVGKIYRAEIRLVALDVKGAFDYCECGKIHWAKHSQLSPKKFSWRYLCGALASSDYYLTIAKYSQENFHSTQPKNHTSTPFIT